MKKICLILTLALLLVGSVQIAFAHHGDREGPFNTENNVRDRNDIGVKYDEENSVRAEVEVRSPHKRIEAEYSGNDEESGKKEFKKIHKKTFKGSKEHRLEFKRSKNELKELKKQSHLCKEKESEECKEFQNNLMEKTHEHFLNSIQHTIGILNKVKDKLENSNIENKEEILENIEKNIESAKAIYEGISSLEDPSKEELKGAAKEIRTVWKDSRKSINHGSNKVINHRIAGVLKKSEKLYDKLVRIVNKLEEKGYDTDVANDKIKEFKDNLVKAEEEYNLAISVEKEANSADEVMKEAQEHLRKSHNYLKEAHKNLKEVVRIIKEAKEGALEEDENEREIEIEVEVEEGRTKVEVEINNKEQKFNLDITSKEEIINEIAARTGLTKEEILNNLEFETEENEK